MGILLGLPLRLLGLLFGLLRFLLPIILLLMVIRLWRRYQRRTGKGGAKKDGPSFRGPVYTVDYEEIKDEDE